MRERIKDLWYRLCRCTGRILFRIFYDFNVYGMENVPTSGGFIIVSNHQSFLDPILNTVFINRSSHFLGRSTLFRNPLFRFLIYSLNAISIERGTADVKAMKIVIDTLKQGEGIVLYPEATRTADGKIRDFKAGFGMIARRSKATIIPTLIDGGYEAWPRSKKFFAINTRLSVSYGKAITPADAKKMKSKDMAEYVTRVIRQMQQEARVRNGREPFDYEQAVE